MKRAPTRAADRFAGLAASSLLGTLVLGAAGTANAAEESALVVLGLGAEYSDNMRREATNQTSDTIITTALETALRRTSTRFDLGLDADLAYDFYTQDTFDSELRGNALLDFDGQIVRNRLSWYVSDSFGQLRLQALAADTPDNRENLNVLTTGPRFTQPIGSRSRFILTGVYEIEDYEVSPFDATRTGGDLSFRHDVSPHQYLEGTVSQRSTEYDADDLAFTDYDIEEYYVTWSVTGAKTTLTASAGQTKTSGDTIDDTSGRYRLDATRKVGKHGNLSLTARSQKADTTTAFRVEQGAGDLTLDAQSRTAVGEPFDFEFLELGYQLGGRRVNGSLSASAERDRYETTDENDRDRNALTASVEWIFTPTWTYGFGVQYAREKYVVNDQRFKDLTYWVDANARLSRTLTMTFGASLSDRSGAVGTNVYDETRARIMVNYTGGKGR
jgi:hypothetical protein